MLGLKLNHVSKRGHCCFMPACLPSSLDSVPGWPEVTPVNVYDDGKSLYLPSILQLHSVVDVPGMIYYSKHCCSRTIKDLKPCSMKCCNSSPTFWFFSFEIYWLYKVPYCLRWAHAPAQIQYCIHIQLMRSKKCDLITMKLLSMPCQPWVHSLVNNLILEERNFAWFRYHALNQ